MLNITTTTKKYANQFTKMSWWQQVLVIVLLLYTFKKMFDLFKYTSVMDHAENFDDDVSMSTLNCTMYYAPWCGHCKTAKPEWEKLEQALHGNVIKITKISITKIDCEANPNIAKEQGIDGFPTFKFEKDGKYYDYNGGRTFDEWKQFIDSIVQ